MKKIILSALMLVGCLSLVSCSNEEKPLRTFELKENQTFTIDKYKFDFAYTPCYCLSYQYDWDNNTGKPINEKYTWHDSKVQNLPFSYTQITIKIFTSTISISVDFDNLALNKLYEDAPNKIWLGGPLQDGESVGLYKEKDENSEYLGSGIFTDADNGLLIYSPSTFDYSDYSLTFNSKTTPFELKEIDK